MARQPRQLPPRRLITLDWYDGPLCTARRCEYEQRPNITTIPLVEVSTYPCRDPEKDHRGPWVSIRLDEDTILQLLAIVRGERVQDWHDDLIDPTEEEPAETTDG